MTIKLIDYDVQKILELIMQADSPKDLFLQLNYLQSYLVNLITENNRTQLEREKHLTEFQEKKTEHYRHALKKRKILGFAKWEQIELDSNELAWQDAERLTDITEKSLRFLFGQIRELNHGVLAATIAEAIKVLERNKSDKNQTILEVVGNEL